MYEFSSFSILDISEAGERKIADSIIVEQIGDGYRINIPDDFTGKKLLVEPLGSYQKRKIYLNDYYTEDSEERKNLDGTWRINDREYTSEYAEISPLASYIVSYKYDSEEYFFLSSQPECFYSNNEEGEVVFNQRTAADETLNYEVELHKYISSTLISDVERTVWLNGKEAQTIKANREYILNKLRYGEKIFLETDRAWSGLENNRNLILTNTEYLSNGHLKYTLLVPERNGQFRFDPSDYTFDHGTLTFKCFGQVITSPVMLARGSKIYYEQRSAEEGYWLAGSNHYVEVTDEMETKRQLEDIHFTPMVRVNVLLPQPQHGGSVIYKLNGTHVEGSSCSTYSGSIITMKMVPWKGWMTEEVEELIYKVGDNQSQVASVGFRTMESLFIEDEDHKPSLKVTLEKSVGENMVFTLHASGCAKEASSYEGGWKVTDLLPTTRNAPVYNLMDNSQIIIQDQKIGTERPIEITMANRAIQTGKAVRMVISKTDDSKKTAKEIRYFDDLSVPLEPITIYPPDELGKSDVWYQSIEITIGVVDVEKYEPATAFKNTTVSLQETESLKYLKKGDLLEGTQKVIVTIKPDTGYYVTGKKVGNGLYQETMKFSEYLKNADNILQSHPAEPYYIITLDTTDPFARYTYKLDGKEVSGTIYSKVGQKLELSYEIRESGYQLEKASGGFLFGLGASKTKAVETIVIDSTMQGKTITKSDFNIKTVKG